MSIGYESPLAGIEGEETFVYGRPTDRTFELSSIVMTMGDVWGQAMEIVDPKSKDLAVENYRAMVEYYRQWAKYVQSLRSQESTWAEIGEAEDRERELIALVMAQKEIIQKVDWSFAG